MPTKKHFERAARIVRDSYTEALEVGVVKLDDRVKAAQALRSILASRFAQLFEDNPRFDRARFYAACDISGKPSDEDS